MAQETIYLLLGALIALTASAITTALIYLLHARNEERKRMWEHQIRQAEVLRAEERALFLKRLDQIEDMATRVYLWAAGLTLKLEDILSVQAWDTPPVQKVIAPLMENSHLLALAETLEDAELEDCLAEYSECIADLIAGLHAIPGDPSPETVDGVMELSTGLREPYTKIIKRIDSLRLNHAPSLRAGTIPSDLSGDA
jgi:hypothetical protein